MKTKKFASILVVAMLVVSMLLCSIPISAATSTAIDTKQTGSVTLYKYDSQTSNSDGSSVTSGAPVEGAGFSFYQILSYSGNGYELTTLAKDAILYNDENANLDEVIDSIVITKTQAYQKDENGNNELDEDNNPIEVPVAGDDGYASYGSTDDLEDLIEIFQAYINSKASSADADTAIKADKTVETDADGKAEATELALGVYLVVETKVPDGYIVTTPSFLVSVPYWESDEDGDSWNYNVVAYPKDVPYEATVDKEIVTDDGTTSADSLAIGDTVNYQVTGKVPSYGHSYRDVVTYSVANEVTEDTFELNKYYVRGDDGNYYVTTEYVKDTVYYTRALKSQNLTDDRTVVSEETYNILPFVFIDTLTEGLTYADNLEIKVSGSPDVTLTQDTEASYDEGTVTWSTGDDVGDYFVSVDTSEDTGKTELTIIIKWDSLDTYQGNGITFTYDAIVNDNAVVTSGNNNDATIYVANNPTTYTGNYSKIVDFDPDDEPGSDPEFTSSTDTATVYTYQLDLTKTFNGKQYNDADINVIPTAVKFEISDGTSESSKIYSFLKTNDGEYTLWTGDTYIYTYTDTDTNTTKNKVYAVVDVIDASGNKVETAGDTYSNEDKYVTDSNVKAYVTGSKDTSELTTELAVGSKGTLTVKGLDGGNNDDNKKVVYYVTETATVDGYAVLAQSVPVQVNDVSSKTITTTYHPFVAYDADDFVEDETYYTLTGAGTDEEPYSYTKIEVTDLSTYVSTTDEIKVVYYATENTVTGNASSDVEATVVGGQVLKEAASEGEAKSGIFKITVNNSKNQFNLPLTGGLGLWLFTIAGGIVMAGAIIFFSTVHKKNKAKKVS